MITWHHFIYFALPAMIAAAVAAWISYKGKRVPALLLYLLAIVIFGSYIAAMWSSLERPPMRTMGETRLWYSFFALVAGAIVYLRWKYKWILSFSTVLAAVFVCMNLLKPEIHNKSMMPALESPFFVPHVVSYMFSYGMLGAALLIAIYTATKQKRLDPQKSAEYMWASDNLVYTGLAFLILGLLLGAIWAKLAWGHYWSWDPKETWAAVTMLSYLIYIHFRLQSPHRIRTAIWVLIISFICLQICWYGVNFLPSAKGISVHTYGA